MGERLLKQDEAETRAERHVKYAPEKAARHLLQSLATRGSELAQRRFLSEIERREACDQFAEDINHLSKETGDISKVKIKVTGSNLLASNIDLTYDETGLSVGVDTTEPYVELGPLAEREGYYYGAPLLPSQDETGYYITPMLILQDTNIVPIRTEDDMPISVIAIQEFTKIPLSGDTYLEIPELEARKARKQALKEVDFRDAAGGKEIMEALRNLKDAFKLTNNFAYMKLEDVSHLHRLGRVDREEANVETVTTALRELFGRERRVVVNSMAYKGIEEGGLEWFAKPGKVVDILSYHEKLQIRGLTLVIETDAIEEDDPALYYVPFDYIESLEF